MNGVVVLLTLTIVLLAPLLRLTYDGGAEGRYDRSNSTLLSAATREGVGCYLQSLNFSKSDQKQSAQ